MAEETKTPEAGSEEKPKGNRRGAGVLPVATPVATAEESIPKPATDLDLPELITAGSKPSVEEDATEYEEIDYLNPDTDTWEKKRVPVIDAGSIMDRYSKVRGGLDGMHTHGFYPADKEVYLGGRDRAHPSTQDAYTRGYRPMVYKKGMTLAPGHTVVRDPNWGGKEVIVYGDLLVMELPKAVAEARVKQAAVQAQKDRAAQFHPDTLRSKAHSMVSDEFGEDGIEVTEARMSTEMITYDESGRALNRGGGVMTTEDGFAERSLNAVVGLQRAEDTALRDARSVFAGFNGPANNGAVPESPFFRQ